MYLLQGIGPNGAYALISSIVIAGAAIEGMSFRKINDPEECATLLTAVFEDKGAAGRVAKAPGKNCESEPLAAQ